MTIKEITVGQDSFLDVVANLVGILIILVVVVSAQAKVASKPAEALKDRTEELADVEQTLSAKRGQAINLELAYEDLNSETRRQIAATVRLNQVRHEMLVQIDIAERLLEENEKAREKQLDEKRLQEKALFQQQQQLTKKLKDIDRSLNAVASATQPKSEVIEHYPNPIAKTVFTEEVHFQIKGGRIVFVPLDELLNRMKAEVESQVDLLRTSPQVVSIVGPIKNFQLQYELVAESIRQPTSNGVLERTMVQFNGFQLIPSSDELGQSVAQELAEAGNSSEFRSIVQRYSAGKTTISIWVYPDSFKEYNEVKNWLYEQGFQVACWPLGADKKISGSPSGFRTSAQ